MPEQPYACKKCGSPVTPKYRAQRRKPYIPTRCEACQIQRQWPWHSAAPIGATRIQQLHGKKPYRWVRVHNPGGKQWIQEHRLVMEQHLGRQLYPYEHVHHKDENDTLNNALSNLVLLTHGQHTALHNRIGDRWAVNYERCRKCGTTEIRHAAHGLCEQCRPRQAGWHRFKPKPTAERMWAHRLRIASCLDCGITERAHYSLGLCWPCYQKRRRREQPERFREYDRRKYEKRGLKFPI